jgi:hypothetical protein
MCYACRLFSPRLALLFFAPFLATPDMQAARDEANRFSVDFSGCTEFVGWGPIALAPAQAVVPAGYTINVAPNGTAGIVVRATSCQGVSINGSEPRSTNLSQIGVNIASPDGSGTINNYTALFVSNNPQLVEHFRDVGLPAAYDRDLLYEFTYDSSGTSGELYVAADGPDIPAYFFSGTESDRSTGSYPSVDRLSANCFRLRRGHAIYQPILAPRPTDRRKSRRPLFLPDRSRQIWQCPSGRLPHSLTQRADGPERKVDWVASSGAR